MINTNTNIANTDNYVESFDFDAWLHDLSALISKDLDFVQYIEDNSDMTFGQPGLA